MTSIAGVRIRVSISAMGSVICINALLYKKFGGSAAIERRWVNPVLICLFALHFLYTVRGPSTDSGGDKKSPVQYSTRPALIIARETNGLQSEKVLIFTQF